MIIIIIVIVRCEIYKCADCSRTILQFKRNILNSTTTTTAAIMSETVVFRENNNTLLRTSPAVCLPSLSLSLSLLLLLISRIMYICMHVFRPSDVHSRRDPRSNNTSRRNTARTRNGTRVSVRVSRRVLMAKNATTVLII